MVKHGDNKEIALRTIQGRRVGCSKGKFDQYPDCEFLIATSASKHAANKSLMLKISNSSRRNGICKDMNTKRPRS